MAWLFLIIGGLFEVAFTFCLGKANEATGNDVYWWYGGFAISIAISMGLLIKATQTLPLGTAYAVWTGIGALGTVLMGILVFKDPVGFWRMFFMFTLVSSIIGIKFVSN